MDEDHLLGIRDPHALRRRDLLRAALGAGLLGSLGADSPTRALLPEAPARSDRIRRENQLPGTTDWQLTYTRVDQAGYRCPWVEGYATRQSLRPGQTLDICVSTDPAAPFTIDIYRMGFYGGAGGRLVGSYGPFPGKAQPLPPVGEQRIRECAWEPALSLAVPEEWTSGVYLAKLTAAASRCQSYAIFIVRDDRPCDLLFQCSDNTWNAYNRWPDEYSLYVNGTGRPLVPDVRTSFDRPYGKYVQIYDNPLSQGSGEFLLWEFPLAFWLEERGYDVSYISNSDTASDMARLLKARCFLSVGHDEYWSLEMYHNIERAIQQGLSVAWLSGNTCCFVTPMTPNSRGVPGRSITRAGRYGGVSEKEKPVMGPFPTEGPNESTIIGARTVSPFNGSGDWTARLPEHWLLEGTGMKAGDSIPGLVGWEFHGDPAPIPGLEVVASANTLNTAGESALFTATVYPGPKGNVVFNASTIFWAQGLSAPPGHMPPYSHYGRPHGPDHRVQRITDNFLRKALV